MSARAWLVAAVALAIAACKGPAGRGAADGAAESPPPGCYAYPYGSVLAQSAALAARFVPASATSCSDVTMGSCVVTTSAVGGAAPMQVGAGVITVSAGATSFTLTPQVTASGTTYQPMLAPQPLWHDAESVVVSAAGGDVPAFATTLTAPTAVTLTMGAGSGGGPMLLPRQDDLVVEWSGGGFGTVDVELLGSGAAAVDVHCRFAPSARSGVVPAALLAMLPATANGALVVSSNNEQLLAAGGWSVDVRLETSAVDASGALADYRVTFQ